MAPGRRRTSSARRPPAPPTPARPRAVARWQPARPETRARCRPDRVVQSLPGTVSLWPAGARSRADHPLTDEPRPPERMSRQPAGRKRGRIRRPRATAPAHRCRERSGCCAAPPARAGAHPRPGPYPAPDRSVPGRVRRASHPPGTARTPRAPTAERGRTVRPVRVRYAARRPRRTPARSGKPRRRRGRWRRRRCRSRRRRCRRAGRWPSPDACRGG